MNTKPSTPFGKFFDKLGIWHPQAENTVKAAYDELHKDVQLAVKTSSGYLAIISDNVDKTPDEVFELIQKKYPGVTKDAVKEFISDVMEKLQIADALPDDFDELIIMLQQYLQRFEGAVWVTVIRGLVAVGSTVLNPNITMIQKVEFVLEYVYQTFIKKQVTEFLPEPAGLK